MLTMKFELLFFLYLYIIYLFLIKKKNTLPENVQPTSINLIRDNIAFLELTFEYTVWYQPNMNINDSQITYYTDEENE